MSRYNEGSCPDIMSIVPLLKVLVKQEDTKAVQTYLKKARVAAGLGGTKPADMFKVMEQAEAFLRNKE